MADSTKSNITFVKKALPSVRYVKIRTIADGIETQADYIPVEGGAVESVNGKTGNVILNGSDINTTVNYDGNPITATLKTHLQNLSDADAEITENITNITASIPNSASSSNPLVTSAELVTIKSDITREITRATQAEQSLTDSINSNTSAISDNLTAIQAEVTRATTAESQLNDKIETNESGITANTTAIEAEVKRATDAEEALQTSITSNATAISNNTALIDSEKSRAEKAESDIQANLTAHIDDVTNPHKVTKSQVGLANVDNTSDLNKPVSTAQAEAISSAVANEATARETAIASLTDKVTNIEGLIPSTASDTNELADKAFVNSTIQTATANFRGNWATWADVPTEADDYPVDYAGSKTPTVNDYLVVSDASGFIGQTLQGTWRFKYSGVWATDGKTGWLPEYQVNEEPLTMAQLDALNSGVTVEKLANMQKGIDDNTSAISSLQASITTDLSQKADIATVTAQLAEKADKTVVESVQDDLTALTTTVAGKADTSTLGTMANESASNYSTTAQANALYAQKDLETTVDTLNTNLSDLSTTVSTKADSSTVTALATTVSGKADSETVNTELATKATKAIDFITPLTADNKGATKAEIDKLEQKINAAGGGNIKLLSRVVADFKYNDVSYLSSNTFSWQSGAVYQAVFQHLSEDLATAGPVQTITIEGIEISFEIASDGHRLCQPDQEDFISQLYALTGEANFYIVDIENERFKLPRTQKRKLIRVWKNDNSWYNLYSDGWIEQGGEINTTAANTIHQLLFLIPMADNKYTVTTSGAYYDISKNDSSGATRRVAAILAGTPIDKTTTGMGFSVGSSTSATNGSAGWKIEGYALASAIADEPVQYEYYYVGNFTQTAVENTAGITAETLNQKADLDLANVLANIDFVVESQLPTAENSYTWYRKYKSGWVEQGGYETNVTSNSRIIHLPVVMADTNYDVFLTPVKAQASLSEFPFLRNVPTVSTVEVKSSGNTISFDRVYWEVKGYAA